MTTGEKTSRHRWLVVWLVLSIILVLGGLWRVRGFTGNNGVVPFQDEYLPSRFDLSGGDEGHRPEGHRPEGHRPEGHRPEGHRPEGYRPDSSTDPTLKSVLAERAVVTNYQEALRNRQLGRLDERWRGEAKGEEWTRETASWLDDEFKRREIPGRLEQPDCRQSLCKLRVVFDDPNAAGKIYAVQLNPRTNWYTDFRVEGERMVVTAYLGAPGNNLRGIINDPFVR